MSCVGTTSWFFDPISTFLLASQPTLSCWGTHSCEDSELVVGDVAQVGHVEPHLEMSPRDYRSSKTS